MIKFIKKIYFKIICYDPIIEELYSFAIISSSQEFNNSLVS